MADINDIKKELMNTKDHTSEFDSADVEKNKILSLFAYLSILLLIPYFLAKDSKFARFHIKQGVVLLIAGLVVYLLDLVLGGIPLVGAIVGIVCAVAWIAIVVLCIMGIYYAVTGKAKELPIINKVNLLK